MDNLAQPPKMADYRFGSLIKGEHYAYARGLTINPSHLPDALDAMYKDGWELMSIFGETDSAKIGFIFKRVKLKAFGVELPADVFHTPMTTPITQPILPPVVPSYTTGENKS